LLTGFQSAWFQPSTRGIGLGLLFLKIDVNRDSRDSDLFPVYKMRFADAARSFAFSLRTKAAFAPYITIAPCALRAGWKGTAPLSGAGEQTPRAIRTCAQCICFIFFANVKWEMGGIN